MENALMKPETGVPSQLQMQLDDILENGDVSIVFQPIVSLRDGTVLGYEALSRGPVNTPLQYPDALFGVAMDAGKLWELEQLCRTKALESAFRSGSDIRLFLNVNPYVIHDGKFMKGFTREYLKSFRIDPANIFFEISEKNAVGDLSGFRETIEHYKKQNYKIAIDDAGAGYSGLNLITDIHPHYIKLDMKLVRDIDRDEYKKSLVRSLYEFCRLSSVSLIAEGIETEAELNTLIDIGVHYGQGYFIQHPEPGIRSVEDGVLDAIRSRNTKKNHIYSHFISNIYIGNLCCGNPTVSPEELSENVYNLFLANPSLAGVTVVSGQTVAGIVTKTRIDHIMSGQFGFSLHAKRPIALIMDRSPLVTDYQVPIDMVSKLAMSRPSPCLYDFIIVTQEGRYAGIVTIRDLLEKAMEIEVSNARHQNPLSGLPGNLIIEQSLARCVALGEPFTVLYFDIDNFKAYNDVYGFENGDSIIRFVAGLLGEHVPRGSFVGHVGGDDFIAILDGYGADDVCQGILETFDREIREFYTPADRLRGFVSAKNRRGEEEQYPLMTLSVAGVTNRNRGFDDIYQLAELAGVVKKKCKQIWQSCFILEE